MKEWLKEKADRVFNKFTSAKNWAFMVATLLFYLKILSENGWLVVFGFFIGANVTQKGIALVKDIKEKIK